MRLRELLTEDRAVSPVIGVILMVAITVILAAVIGTFVLGLGDRVASAPQAQISFAASENGGSAESIELTHDGGDSLSASNLEVKVGSKTAYEDGSAPSGGTTWGGNGGTASGWSSAVTAGNTLTITDSGDGTSGTAATNTHIDDGETVRLIWDSPESDKTATIFDAEVGY